jgi:hypothetical protein
MMMEWDEVAAVFQGWLYDDSVLLAQSTLTEFVGTFKVVIVGVIAGESSFVLGLRELSDDTVSPIRELAIDLTGYTFSLRTLPQTSLPLLSLFASKSPVETICFSQKQMAVGYRNCAPAKTCS